MTETNTISMNIYELGTAAGAIVTVISGMFWKFFKEMEKKQKETNKLLNEGAERGKRIEHSVNGDLDQRMRSIIKDELNNKHETNT